MRKLLRNVNGSYGDFVDWVVDEMEEYGKEDDYTELIKKLEDNPNISTDEILETAYYHERPEIVIVDDDEV